MPHENELHHTIESGLDAAAASVDTGDAGAMLTEVRATVGRRRRRRQVAGGIAAVGVLGASGLVIANLSGSNGDDLIVSAPASAPESVVDPDAQPDEEATATTVEDTEFDTAPPAATGPTTLEVTPANIDIVSDDGLVIEQTNVGNTQLFEWQGGFLALHDEYRPQPLPSELPDSVVEQFPQEVVDLFVDGLPPTIDEAIAMLQEAGLYDVVTEVVTGDPEVLDAIYSQPTEQITTARFSPDGVEWNDIDFEYPADGDQWADRSSTGDRFVVVSAVDDGPGPGDPAGSSATAAQVWSSTNLIDWEVQTVPLEPRPVDLADFILYETGPGSIAVNDNGWILSTYTYVDVDAVSLLDDANRERSERGEIYAGSSWGPDGVTIEIYEANDSSDGGMSDQGEALLVTWAELGLDAAPDGLDQNNSVDHASAWGGEPQIVDLDGASRGDRFLGTDDGFVAYGETLRFSPDGVAWTSLAVPIEAYVDWVIETENGLLVSTFDNLGGQVRFLVDPAVGEFTPIELEELPTTAQSDTVGNDFAVLADHGPSSEVSFAFGGSLAVVESNGYRFELEVRFSGEKTAAATYTLTDIETGEVVSTESIEDLTGNLDETEFEFASEEYDVDGAGREGFRVFDPETGDELIAVAFESMTYTQLDDNGEEIPGSTDVFPEFDEPQSPEMYLIASIGSSLVIEPLPSNPDFFVSSVAITGDAALVAGSDGSFTRITADR